MRDPSSTSAVATHGTHWLVDCHGVDSALLEDAEALRTILRAAAEAAGARLLFDHFHDFATGGAAGVTGVVLLAESHATIHTWPADGFAAIDFFLCGGTEPARAVACLESRFAPARLVVRSARRGAANGGPD